MFNQTLFTKYFKNANQGGLGEISKALLKERGKVQALNAGLKNCYIKSR